MAVRNYVVYVSYERYSLARTAGKGSTSAEYYVAVSDAGPAHYAEVESCVKSTLGTAAWAAVAVYFA